MIDELAKAADAEIIRQYEANPKWDDAKDVIEGLDTDAIVSALLRRLREPTEAMKVAGGLAFEDAAFGEQMLVFDAAGLSFTAMIDAALGEKA